MEPEKLKNIQERIKEFQTSTSSASKLKKEITPFTIAIDLVSGTMIGVISGILIDKLFDSKPLCLILFTVIGIAAGFNIIWQRLNNKNK